MQDFKQLQVWQKAHQMTLEIYGKTKDFPKEEAFGLTSQLRRSSSSIGANLAEGCGRSSRADFARFGQIAFGSACETEYHLLLAYDLGFLQDESYRNLSAELLSVKRMLSALLKKLKTEDRQPTT